MVMHDKLINHSNDKLSHSCLISATGQFIIPINHVPGDSAYQRVLNQLKLSKQQKKTEVKKEEGGGKNRGRTQYEITTRCR